MNDLIKTLKLFTIGSVFAGIPLWFAISYIDIFIKLTILFFLIVGMFGMGLIIAGTNKKLDKWVMGKDE